MVITQNSNTQQFDDFLDYALEFGFGDLHFKVDPNTGMKAIIAIHSTKLGPALGGCRFISYPNTQSAIIDAMRLARGMTYKAAITDLSIGGGKSVIIKPQGLYSRRDYLLAFGSFIEELNGRYITALDSGTDLADMDIIAQKTSYVASLSTDNGDPAPHTAYGILRGIEAAVYFKLGKNDLGGLHIAIQGLGHVGLNLAALLFERGVRLTVADLDPAKTERAHTNFNATVVPTSEIHKIPCDVFSPCALGNIINETTINQFQTTIIAGAANNQLAHTSLAQIMHDMHILYTPDYVINAGGLIFASGQYFSTDKTIVNQQIANIYEHLLEIFSRSMQENKSPSYIADAYAEEKLAKA